MMYAFPPRIDSVETKRVLKQLASTRAALAELKGISATIPNQQILIDTLVLQEAKDSSTIENIITTHDEIYRSDFTEQSFATAGAKEVHYYAEAVKRGFKALVEKRILTVNDLVVIQQTIERNNAGIRALPGTVLKDDRTGEVVYTPPQDKSDILKFLAELEKFINDDNVFFTDPLIKMALIHHRFESIHPFYDGNGRTGRILNLLYLIQQGLLDIPILYISRYINHTRDEYYALLQSVRIGEDWESWILYMLKSVEQTSISTLSTIQEIKRLMQHFKQTIRGTEPRIYSQDLINNLFRHPYTRISYLEKELGVSRLTATRYLNKLVDIGILKKQKVGRTSLYINEPLYSLLIGTEFELSSISK